MMNYLSDQIHASAGLPRSFGARFPTRPAPIHAEGVQLNNISVNNSVIGTLNTGTIGSVDQSISALLHVGQPGTAAAIKSLTEAVLKSADLSQNQQREVIEILSLVAREASAPISERKSTVAATLIARASQLTSAANDISELCARHWPVILALFTAAGA